jgi:hypothetical protein
MIQNHKPERKAIGSRNGIKVYKKLQGKTSLKTKKPINKITEKQKTRNKIWSENTNKRIVELDYTCQWCGKRGQRTGTLNFLSGHHIEKRRFNNDDISNVYVAHWITCHQFIEQKSIDVRIYKTRKEWERING